MYVASGNLILCTSILLIIKINYANTLDVTGTMNSTQQEMRYLLYDVNPGEGFNLRRDVYMRMANMVKLMNKKESWTLVLPPWGRLYHWQSRDLQQEQIPWSLFFDVESLRKHVPVIEFTEYLQLMDKPIVEQVYYLQRYKEGWGGKWEEKIDLRECIDQRTGFEKDKEGKWRWHFWGYGHVHALKFDCVSVQMEYSSLLNFIITNTTARSVLINRAETTNHGARSNWHTDYWTARRSMRFSNQLCKIADEFREKFLDSDDVRDKTMMEEDWRYMQREYGDAIGGPYLAVHLRRKDFTRGYKNDVPSIKGAAEQIKDFLTAKSLDTVFIATDAPKDEYQELKGLLSTEFKVFRYVPAQDILNEYKDGGIAIIDQWICAHARYFLGTSVSTFSFRIHEEREILGFRQATTYNKLCGENVDEPCEQSTKWEIQYETFHKPKEEL